jgi:hypothetical protein
MEKEIIPFGGKTSLHDQEFNIQDAYVIFQAPGAQPTTEMIDTSCRVPKISWHVPELSPPCCSVHLEF